jgi:hypothetical protein
VVHENIKWNYATIADVVTLTVAAGETITVSEYYVNVEMNKI